MPKIQVAQSDLQNAIRELQDNNVEFRNRVSELQVKQQELTGQWQGEANTAFNKAFSSDFGQWSAFANLIDQYVQALQTIMQTYETAESTNTGTASTRTY